MNATLRTLVSLIGLCCGTAPAVTLQYSVHDLGESLFRIEYYVGAATFLENQEIEIQFDPNLYASLSNPIVPLGFDVLLFQPGNPLGAPGRFSAAALEDIAVVSGLFRVDARTRSRALGADWAQEFAINQLDDGGFITQVLEQGRTTPAVPEPATLLLTGAALLFVAAALPAWRRRLAKTG